MEDTPFELTDVLLKNMAAARVDHDHKTTINSLDFSDDGLWLVSCDDFSLNIYDVLQGKRIKTLYNKVSRIDLVKFTHNKHAVLCATKVDNKILYWSIFENEIIKVFQGHDDTIICLEINLANDYFLSSGKDQKFKLWDLSKEDDSPLAVVDLSNKKSIVVGNFDPAGVLFAIAYVDSHVNENPVNKIRLYDIEKYSEGSFNSWNVECPEIRMMKFSNSGTYLLLSTVENCILILDAYEGSVKRKFTSYSNESSLTIEASFTPDSKYVVSGSEDGAVVAWSVESGQEVARLEGHLKPSLNVKFNPSHVLMASGCKNLILWLPKDWIDK